MNRAKGLEATKPCLNAKNIQVVAGETVAQPEKDLLRWNASITNAETSILIFLGKSTEMNHEQFSKWIDNTHALVYVSTGNSVFYILDHIYRFTTLKKNKT